MVDFIDNPLLLERSMNEFIYSSGCPAPLRDKLTAIPGSQADKLTVGAQILYAHYDELNEDGKRAMGQIFEYALNKNWTQYVVDNDAQRLVDYTERDLGEQGAIQPPSDPLEWPAPQASFRDNIDWRQPPEEVDPEEEQED